MQQIKSDLHGAARVQPRADFAGKAGAFQRRRPRQTAVPANELFAISGQSAGDITHVQEHEAIGEFGVVVIARQ